MSPENQQQEEIDCRVRAARALLDGVLERRVNLADVGDGTVALIIRAMAIDGGDWERFVAEVGGEDDG